MAQKKRPTCFISYCHENADSDSLQHFVQALRKTSRSQIDFLFDEDLNPGEDVPQFMEMLTKVDGVLIVLTPEYNQRVINRQGGVYTEYKYILDRYQQQLDEANMLGGNLEEPGSSTPSPFCLIPVLFSGSHATSCPTELKRPVCVDFTQYRAHRARNQTFVSSAVQTKHNPTISKIVSQIFTRHSLKREQVAKSFEELLSRFFLTTKHEHLSGDPKFESELEHVFVKTHPYSKVEQQISYLLIGRKGSGKSTLVDYIARNSEDRYKGAITISVDNFDLEYIYTVLTPKQVHSEFDTVIPRIEIFEVVWELFLTLCCMNTLVEEEGQGRLKQSQMQHTPTLVRLIQSITGANLESGRKLDYKALFHWAYARVVSQIEKAIVSSRSGVAEFAYDITASLDAGQILASTLSKDVLDAFEAVLNQCSKRFLISLDGFDTAFEKFRIRTQMSVDDRSERRKRTEFEIDWLSGFAHIVIAMKSSPRRTALSNLSDFCATIPKDRFVEIRDSERDGYMYIGKCYEIRWSAIELAILLYKRLEVLDSGFRSHKGDQPHKRLENVLRNAYTYIPLETTTTMDGVDHTMPLFIDVLRHTFWRPREILIYFAKIIAVLRDIKRRNLEITPFAVGKCISDTTRDVIRTEFLNEFQRHCTNLRGIIERFRRNKQILTKDEVEKIVGGYAFSFVDRDTEVTDFPTQMRFLYEIGFIGLEADRKVVERLKLLHTDVFWFNAGDEPFDVMLLENFLDCKFIIHPIFCEFLDLDVRNQRLTLKFDWNYLQEQESYVVVPS